jgi:hypothetical protein
MRINLNLYLFLYIWAEQKTAGHLYKVKRFEDWWILSIRLVHGYVSRFSESLIF